MGNTTIYSDGRGLINAPTPGAAVVVIPPDDQKPAYVTAPASVASDWPHDWLPWALGGGGALLAHSLGSSLFANDSPEKRRSESVWQKLLRALAPVCIGGLGGYAGYALGKRLKQASAQVVYKGSVPHSMRPVTNAVGTVYNIVDSVTDKQYADWSRAHGKDDPAEAMEMQRQSIEDDRRLIGNVGKGLKDVGLVGGSVGGVAGLLKRPTQSVNDISLYEQAQRASDAKLALAKSKLKELHEALDPAKGVKEFAKQNAKVKEQQKVVKERQQASMMYRAVKPISRLRRGMMWTIPGLMSWLGGVYADRLATDLGREANDVAAQARRQRENDEAVAYFLRQARGR